MKKKIVAALLATTLICVALFASSCTSIKDLISNKEYSLSVTRFSFLDDATITDRSDGAGRIVVYKNDDLEGRKYYVVDLKTGTSLLTSDEELYVLDEGIFYYTEEGDNGETLYTFKSVNGASNLPTAQKGVVFSRVFTDEGGTRYYLNVKGDFVEEPDPFAVVLPKGEAYKLDCGKYLSTEGDVFDKKGKYEYTISDIDFSIPENAEHMSSVKIGDSIIVQYVIILPESEDDYDLFYDGEKMQLLTYRYSLKDGKVKKIRNFDYLLDSVVYTCEEKNTAIVTCQKIEDKFVMQEEIVQSFNEKGKVAVDLQELLPNAKMARVQGEYLNLTSQGGNLAIFKGSKKVLSINGTVSLNILSNGMAYYKTGSNVYVYDIVEKEVVKTFYNVERTAITTGGNLCLETLQESVREYIVYNTKNNTTFSKEITYSVINSGTVYRLCEDTLVFPDATNLNITGVESVDLLGSVSVSDDEAVRIIRVENADGNEVVYAVTEKVA